MVVFKESPAALEQDPHQKRLAKQLFDLIKAKQGEAKAQAFDATFKAANETGDWYTIVESLLAPVQVVFNELDVVVDADNRPKDKTEEVRNFFMVLYSVIVFNVKEDAELKRTVLLVCTTLMSNPKQHTEARLKLLMMLYNTFEDGASANKRPAILHEVLKCVLTYAGDAKQFDFVLPFLEYLDDWMTSYNLTEEEHRALLLTLADQMRKMDKRQDAFDYLQKHVNLLSKDEASSKDAEKQALRLVTDAITLPSIFQFDNVLQLPAVQALKKSNAPLIQLLEIFVNGDLNDLQSFQKKHPKIFEDEISFSACMSKLRLLVLATAAQGKTELELSEISQVLQVSVDETEVWIVRAIASGVIEGRIDQVRKLVTIQSAFQRVFGDDQWKSLDDRISDWIEHSEALLKVMGVKSTLGV
mmetsp:Transcript_42948/g.91064  ORF Transcript_42948/g.91064 Transcript_42948/m.91064 type:complete len:415 (-) Transcript_42948:203-1447(-)